MLLCSFINPSASFAQWGDVAGTIAGAMIREAIRQQQIEQQRQYLQQRRYYQYPDRQSANNNNRPRYQKPHDPARYTERRERDTAAGNNYHQPVSENSFNKAKIFDNFCQKGSGASEQIVSCTQVINQSSNDDILEKAYNRRGLAYMKLGNYPSAIEDFNKVINLNPKIAGYYDNRQNAYRLNGQNDLAFRDANKAIQLAPTYSFVYRARGNLYSIVEQYDPAIQDYNMAINLDRSNSGLYYERGLVLQKQGKFTEALRDFEKALSVDTNNALAIKQQAITYGKMQDLATAKTLLEKYLEIKPEDSEARAELNRIILLIPNSDKNNQPQDSNNKDIAGNTSNGNSRENNSDVVIDDEVPNQKTSIDNSIVEPEILNSKILQPIKGPIDWLFNNVKNLYPTIAEGNLIYGILLLFIMLVALASYAMVVANKRRESPIHRNDIRVEPPIGPIDPNGVGQAVIENIDDNAKKLDGQTIQYEIEALEKLLKLKDINAITDTEFLKQKEKILTDPLLT